LKTKGGLTRETPKKYNGQGPTGGRPAEVGEKGVVRQIKLFHIIRSTGNTIVSVQIRIVRFEKSQEELLRGKGSLCLCSIVIPFACMKKKKKFSKIGH